MKHKLRNDHIPPLFGIGVPILALLLGSQSTAKQIASQAFEAASLDWVTRFLQNVLKLPLDKALFLLLSQSSWQLSILDLLKDK